MREGTVLEFQIVINVITWPYTKYPSIYYDLIAILRTRCKCSLNRPDPNFKTSFVCTFSSGSQINSFKAMTEVKRSCFYPRSIVSTFSRLKIGAICTTRVTGFGVSLVNCALLELCSSAWYRLSSYAPYS